MLQILLISGDYYHATAFYEICLRDSLECIDARVQVERTARPLSEIRLHDFNVIILNREAVAIEGHLRRDYEMRWLTLAEEQSLVDWVERGGTLIAWHSGLASYRPEGVGKLYGGRFMGHPPIHQFNVEVTYPQHPMAEGVTAFQPYDELYRFEFEDQNPAREVFMEASSTESAPQPIAWTQAHGKGQLLAWQLGHLMETMRHPSGQRLLKNYLNSVTA